MTVYSWYTVKYYSWSHYVEYTNHNSQNSFSNSQWESQKSTLEPLPPYFHWTFFFIETKVYFVIQLGLGIQAIHMYSFDCFRPGSFIANIA